MGLALYRKFDTARVARMNDTPVGARYGGDKAHCNRKKGE
jgi:hypothetical protein